jgi:hypothetical protein
MGNLDLIEAPLPSTYDDPDFKYNPEALTELAFRHGDTNNPSPAGLILQAIPPFFIYTIPLPSTILLPADARTPVANDGNTLLKRNLPAVASSGSSAPMNPP